MSICLTNTQKFGSIEVIQDNDHFLVRIHPKNRERAKKIAGRQWDGERRVWVFPKDSSTYHALFEEFKNDADKFEIDPPKTEPSLVLKQTDKDTDGEELDEFPPTASLDEGQANINDQLDYICGMVGAIHEIATNQHLTIAELSSHQTETAKILKRIETPGPEIIKTEVVEILPKLLNFDNPKERYLLEKALLDIAVSYNEYKKNETFRKWVESRSPIENPIEFIIATHANLKYQLANLVGESDPKDGFADLIKQASQGDYIFKSDDPIRVYPVLRALNEIRNYVVYKRGIFHPSERRVMAIIYLMQLALVWPKIMVDTDDG